MKDSLGIEIMSGSILKLLRHKQFVNRERTPISAQFVLTNVCNLRCIFCINNTKKNYEWCKKTMSKQDVLKTITDLSDLGVKGIEFTGGGEPTLHPNFDDIIKYTVSLGIKPSLVTNGVTLKNIPIDILKQMDWIRVSINAGRDNYVKVHGVDCFDDVMDGLEYIEKIDIPNKGVSHIFCDSSDIKDSQDLLDELQKFSLDYFRFSVDVLDDFKISSTTLKSENIPVIDHSNRPKGVPKTCGIFYYKPVIDCDGKVYPCCVNLFREKLSLGHVRDIKDIISNKNIKIDVSKCAYCIYGEVNNLINGMDQSIKNECFI